MPFHLQHFSYYVILLTNFAYRFPMWQYDKDEKQCSTGALGPFRPTEKWYRKRADFDSMGKQRVLSTGQHLFSRTWADAIFQTGNTARLASSIQVKNTPVNWAASFQRSVPRSASSTDEARPETWAQLPRISTAPPDSQPSTWRTNKHINKTASFTVNHKYLL